jgi:hypothetical protein
LDKFYLLLLIDEVHLRNEEVEVEVQDAIFCDFSFEVGIYLVFIFDAMEYAYES